MQLSVEPTLLERAVFRATRTDARLTDEYQRAFSGCYREPPGDRRDQAFTEMHERWFDQLGLRGRILERVRLFSHVTAEVRRIVIADARSRRRASVELFGKPGSHAVVIALTPELLLDATAFDYWARFELQHVEDMLDPEFCYDARALPSESDGAANSRMRDRFALLWAVIIDARLAGLPTAPCALRDRRGGELRCAFGLHAAAAQAALDRLWSLSDPAARPNHPTLLAWARDGLPHCESTAADGNGSDLVPQSGAACPLCRFSTFDWLDSAELDEDVVSFIRAEFPAWKRADGICGRCAELYRSRRQQRPAV
jgi:hypothetical protein